MKKVPVIDLGPCTDCEGCISVCPAVFQRNEATGRIEVIAMECYPVEEVNETIKNCPKDCISWEDDKP